MTIYLEPQNFPAGARMIDGVWCQTLTPRAETEHRPALFLDRDGVVVQEAHYLHKVEDVSLTPNAAQTIQAANARAIPVILVTNQAGVGYGYFGWDEFVAVQERILGNLAAAGARIDGVFACPFHAKANPPYRHDNHRARKPNPGMLILAKDLLGVDLKASWIVGDRTLDVLAGKNAGLSGGVHVATGHGSKDGERAGALAAADQHYTVRGAANLGAAREHIALLD